MKPETRQRVIEDLLRRRQSVIDMCNQQPSRARSPSFMRIIERYDRMLASYGIVVSDD